MRLLLDTQIFLWMNANPERLGNLESPIQDPSNQLFLSAASSWEVAIKYGLGRLTLPESPSEYIPSRMIATGVGRLAVEHVHALAVAGLDDHHRDPFDRLIVAQSILEDMTVATADPVFSRYTRNLIGP